MPCKESCNFAGFMWMYLELSYAQLSLVICVSMYRKYRHMENVTLFGRVFDVKVWHGIFRVYLR